jgi:hypothetical protein
VQNQDLANRFVTYADALVAVTFVGMSAMGVAVGDPDLRCEFVRAPGAIVIGNLLMGIVFSSILIVLRRWEMSLRSDESPAEPAARYERILSIARHVILWFCVIATITLVSAASRDEMCRVIQGATS